MDKKGEALELALRGLGLAFGALCGIQMSGTLGYSKKGLDGVVDELKETIESITILMKEPTDADNQGAGGDSIK